MQKKIFEKLKEQNKKSNDTKTENKEEEYEIHEILLPGLSKGYGSQKEALKHLLKTPNNSKQQGVQRVIFHVKNVNSLKLTSKDYFVYRLKGDVLCHKILKVDEKTQQIILKPVLKSDEKEPEEYTDSDEDWYKEQEANDGLNPGFNQSNESDWEDHEDDSEQEPSSEEKKALRVHVFELEAKFHDKPKLDLYKKKKRAHDLWLNNQA